MQINIGQIIFQTFHVGKMENQEPRYYMLLSIVNSSRHKFPLLASS